MQLYDKTCGCFRRLQLQRCCMRCMHFVCTYGMHCKWCVEEWHDGDLDKLGDHLQRIAHMGLQCKHMMQGQNISLRKGLTRMLEGIAL